ncbi:MAG TPA: tRNA lysidine(34) synthetase TilS [Thermoanaerobaculia bacterium]|nr:tRNA lysidine(34) synthetase TilS [Thermoanaerobaculia bacterium]
MDLLEALQAFLRRLPPDPGDRLVVAFSGGCDSTALLWGLTRLAPSWGIQLVAAHLDHGMDAASPARAVGAAGLARRLGVPLVGARRTLGVHRRPGESPEAAARRIRYEFLDEVRRGCRARHVATAHHRDDQAETVLLRLRFGSGLRGLTAIQAIQEEAGSVVRPLLALPRATLRQAVAAAGLTPVEDPGNHDPRQPRSRMRHQVLPALAGLAAVDAVDQARLAADLANLATRAQRALPALDRRLAAAIGLRVETGKSGENAETGETGAADRRRLAALPPPLLPFALALLHRRAGAAYPASLAAAAELRRQLRPGRRVACDCGAGWRWQAAGETLRLLRVHPGETITPFTYTLEIPGELAIPELAVTIRVSRQPVEAWMLRGAPLRAGLALPLPDSGRPGRVTVRNRRPGDRLRPLGAPGSRKLKDVLIDRGVPRWQRDRLPLLCWAGEIAWVPGITIDHRFRLTGEPTACLAEISEISEISEMTEIRALGRRVGWGAHPASTGNPGRESAVSDSEGTSLPLPPPPSGVAHQAGRVGPAPLEVAEL